MIIIGENTRTSYVKATIPAYIEKGFYSNHKVIINRFSASQTLPSSFLQVVRIQYDQPLLATIIKNSDL